MEAPHKCEYRIRDLPTRSVTLFPTRAQVVREIKDVALKPGANEITIVGLTPTADEDSIKVEGTGAAIITDIAVTLLPNNDIFEDIYPDSDDDEDKDTSEDDEEEDEAEDINKALEDVRDNITSLSDEQKRAKEIIASAESRLKMLDAYGVSLDKRRNVDIETGVETYRKEREKVFQDHMEGIIRDRELTRDISKLRLEQRRLEKSERKEKDKAAKAKAKVQRAKDKLKEKLRRREEERLNEKTRVRTEREQFWPRSCYTVRITLDATSFSPTPSRRSSIASASDIVKIVSEKEGGPPSEDFTCSLSLSYVTSSAFWSPSYDLALSTTTSSALLCFDAQLTNMTSETWENCKVILSTSQTTFSGLKDDIPILQPWRIKLAGKGNGTLVNDAVQSREERAEQNVWQTSLNYYQSQKPRAELFGIKGSVNPYMQAHVQAKAQQMQQMQPQQQQMQMQMQQQHVQQMAYQQHGRTAYRSAPPPPGASLFGSVAPAAPAPTAFGGGGFGAAANSNIGPTTLSDALAAAPLKRKEVSRRGGGRFFAEDDDENEDDGATMLEPTPALDFQESSFEETGLTATYDLPNLKTLKPSSTASKQRVARISFSNVQFSRTVVAKYRPVAYLKARLRNTSKLTLLRGPTGLTLDGTFMGRSRLPRVSAGDIFPLSLGVDPAIRVIYPEPDVKRSTTGVFTKGDNSVYTRTITIANTRATAGKPVNLTVFDQVPVSEDEKLRIDILHPRGMTIAAADGIPTGRPGRDAKEEKDWGKASAVLKKGGEVSWDVELNAGRCVKLMLEYEVALPAGERVMQCD
ncbi:hypothetical protein B0T26DRAFT_711427 [Lasiosphaeria miniovina]|uniref:Mucoidy inhibitor-like protein n=1 Tax=Lasiosphaeria miniovina TaxID=1954250 RepID=A0AA40ALC1_9PEZI|nr:uncharacterized protein B0T26DRAFT_711427 [Lasiosphaeria miniovina]KAK0717953.1 hypothetical protein B0T26DRAFT_711427 [Lasiosphaeria miniovina]